MMLLMRTETCDEDLLPLSSKVGAALHAWS